MSRIRVLIADDHALVRAGFRTLVETEDDLELVGEASTGHEVLDLVRKVRADVVLMDIRMPELDGIEATLSGSPPTRIWLAYTSSSSPRSITTSTCWPPYGPARAVFWSRTPIRSSCCGRSGWSPAATVCSPPVSPGG